MIGGDGDDFLIGGAGNDSLNGGAGNDSLVGGVGNDAYYVDSVGDIVIENSNEGSDTVFATVDYGLTENVENLTLRGEAVTAIGNSLNNRLTGNALDNILSGGAGNDTLIGGDGDDFLLGGEGNDNLNGGAGNDSLTGGFGNDVLFGGEGNDQFILNGPNEGVDTISDFNSAEDIIVISAAAFGGGLVAGAPMSDDLLRVGLGIGDAATASQRFIYNQSNGKLFFDADGSDSTFSATHIATLSNRSSLGASNFSVVDGASATV